MKQLYVRCMDKMVFPIHKKTLEALSCSTYDAYCFSASDNEIEYIDYLDWLGLRNSRRNDGL